MATREVKTMRFKWGEVVRVRDSASTGFHPGEIGSICGIRVIETMPVAESIGEPVGTKLYLIEFGDGSSIDKGKRGQATLN